MNNLDQIAGDENKKQETRSGPDTANIVQIRLIQKLYGEKEDVQKWLKWVNKYSKRFREIIVTNPELLAHFKTEPDAVLDEIEHLLYGEKLDKAA